MSQFIDAKPYAWPFDGGLRPDSTALLIIDMQRDFCDPEGYVASMGYDLGDFRAVIPRVQAVRAAISAWGGTIIYTREGHRPDLTDLPPQKAWRSRHAGAEIGTAGPLGQFLVRGEAGWEILTELAPARGEIVVDKPGYSAFYATDLHRILNARGIRNLVFTGVTTDVCVHSTLRAAVDLGYECLTIADACAATNRACHDAAIDSVMGEGGIFGAVTQSASLCASLRQAVSPLLEA